jgi:hypothetical protein
MTEASNKAPWHLWAVGIFATLFNAIGVFDFTMAMAQGAKYLESAGMTAPQVAHYLGMPGWATAIWAIGVFAAFIASILLLMRRRLAYPVFVVSLAAFAVHLFYEYVLTDGGALMGGQMAITSAVIALLLALFAGYARAMTARGVLH